MSDTPQPSIEEMQRQIAALQAQIEAQQTAEKKTAKKPRPKTGAVENSGDIGGSVITGKVSTTGGKVVGGDDNSNNTTIINPPPIDPAEAARLRYLRGLREQCNYLPLAAMGGQEDVGKDITLNDVYIDLMCKDNDSGREMADASGEGQEIAMLRQRRSGKDKDSDTDADRVSALEIVAKHALVALLGGPGSGKSTFINQLAAELATERLGEPCKLRAKIGENNKKVDPDLLRRFPLRITLRDLAPKLTALKLDNLSEKRQHDLLIGALREQWRDELKRHEALTFDER